MGLGDAFQLEWYLDNRHGIVWAELGSFSRTPGSSERLERSKNQIHALIVPINDHLPQCREHNTMDQPAYDLSVIFFYRKLVYYCKPLRVDTCAFRHSNPDSCSSPGIYRQNNASYPSSMITGEKDNGSSTVPPVAFGAQQTPGFPRGP